MRAVGRQRLHKLTRLAVFAVASSITSHPAHAVQRAQSGPSEQQLTLDLKAQEDAATILKSRAWIEGEWNNDREEASSFEFTLGVRKGWRISEGHDWAVQLQLPFRRTSVGDWEDINQGLADIKATIGTAMKLGAVVRIGGGVELRMPTGERQLSANIWRLQEFAALAWDATPWLTVTPKVSHYHTIARNHGAAPQHYVELFLPATFLLPDRWSVTPRYKAKIDFESDSTTHYGRLAIGKQLKRPELGLGLSLEVPFSRVTNQFQLILSATKNF